MVISRSQMKFQVSKPPLKEMKWFLVATMCLPGYNEQLCLKMHSDIIYQTSETCVQQRNEYFYKLSTVVNEYKGQFSIRCIDSFSIQEFLGETE